MKSRTHTQINLMTHIIAGYPTLKESEKIALTMAKEGVSFVEIQIPFSDPIADGPTIMKANETALKNGITTKKALALVKRITRKTKTPILIMTYFNIAFKYGLAKFCREAQEAGVYGLIIPDIPLDEEPHENYLGLCKKHNLHPIQVISPITPERRLKLISKIASGFVYCVSRYGTTGENAALNPNLASYLAKARKHIKIPLALGFGISTPAQTKEAAKHADIVVIGSKIINLISNSPKPLHSLQTQIRNFLQP
jgi:tryptophan synthase alpha chain